MLLSAYFPRRLRKNAPKRLQCVSVHMSSPCRVSIITTGVGTSTRSFRDPTDQAASRCCHPDSLIDFLLTSKQNILESKTTYSRSFLLILMFTMLPLALNITSAFVR